MTDALRRSGSTPAGMPGLATLTKGDPVRPSETWTDPEDRRPVAARIDLHCHSAFSRDALGTLDEIAREASARRLDGVCITDHDTIRHHGAIEDWNRSRRIPSVTLWPGAEISSAEGHILAIGIREPVAKGLTPEDTIDAVLAAGGVPVPSHPLRRGSGIGRRALDEIGSILRSVEVWNAQEPERRTDDIHAWATTNGVGGTGGSDAHQVHDTGNAYTLFPEPVDDLDALLDQVGAGKTWGVGVRTPLRTLARQATRNTLRRVTGRLKD